ncbi:hypothetical protein IWX49DRAFT_240365 [Phyllosticta citricarpa]|uniref:Uncharacterized protein n=1 Tax=Phyllosticta citricarpa TaxID=55181 RepID=A0ABR1MFA7_9PEZI
MCSKPACLPSCTSAPTHSLSLSLPPPPLPALLVLPALLPTPLLLRASTPSFITSSSPSSSLLLSSSSSLSSALCLKRLLKRAAPPATVDDDAAAVDFPDAVVEASVAAASPPYRSVQSRSRSRSPSPSPPMLSPNCWSSSPSPAAPLAESPVPCSAAARLRSASRAANWRRARDGRTLRGAGVMGEASASGEPAAAARGVLGVAGSFALSAASLGSCVDSDSGDCWEERGPVLAETLDFTCGGVRDGLGDVVSKGMIRKGEGKGRDRRRMDGILAVA